uniref:Uncharacterized protein n=1 Tax=Anguilla anguilla TaxID=7936 RepID=A0A0E9PS46_ANGAN
MKQQCPAVRPCFRLHTAFVDPSSQATSVDEPSQGSGGTSCQFPVQPFNPRRI